MQSDQADADDVSKCILRAFRVVDGVGRQVAALQGVLESEILSLRNDHDLKVVGKNYEPNAGGVESSSEWVSRLTLDTFLVVDLGRGSRIRAYGGFQISLAPCSSDDDEEFFPNLAILLANREWDCGWGIGEFEFGTSSLQQVNQNLNDQDEGFSWSKDKTEELRWEDADKSLVALVVPLAALSSSNDVIEKVIEPMKVELRRFQNNGQCRP